MEIYNKLPESIQQKVFLYLSTPTSDLIKNINWKNQFYRQVGRQLLNKQIVNIDFSNVFGYVDVFDRSIFHLHNSNNINMNYIKYELKTHVKFINLGISKDMKKKELIDYCKLNSVDIKTHWNKHKLIQILCKI